MRTEEIVFSNGPIRLAGTLHLPDGPGPHPAVVAVHPAGEATRTAPFFAHLRSHLPPAGLAVLIYDRRGSGASDGDFETSGFDELAGDAAAAVDLLRAHLEIDPDRIFLHGASQGGWIAPLAAGLRPEIAGLVIVSGSGVSPAEQMDYAAGYHLGEAGFSAHTAARALALRRQVNEYYRGRLPRARVQAAIDRARAEPWFPLAFIGDEPLPEDVRADKWFYELDHDPLPAWAAVRQPALFLFAANDRWVPVAESLTRFRAAAAHLPDLTMLQLPATDHLMGDPADPDPTHVSGRYLDVMLDWLKRRL